VDEFLSNVISYDSRLLRTLKAMILKPGRISQDYVDGKRMRYTNPFRFLLSLAIIYFLMYGMSGDFSGLDRYGEQESILAFNPEEVISLTTAEGSPEREEALKIVDSVDIAGSFSRFRSQKDSLITHDPRGYFATISGDGLLGRLGEKSEFFSSLLKKDSIAGFEDAMEKYGVENSMENKLSFSMANSLLKVSRQPGTFLSSLISRLPFATFFFLPVFAFFIMLVYIRKTYTYTDNLIFSFHNQSLLFILLIISLLIDAIFDISTAWIALTIFSILLYQAMRNFYGQSTFKTIIKYLFLNTIFIILAGMAGVIFILASAFTY
jgi:hypothetical protein